MYLVYGLFGLGAAAAIYGLVTGRLNFLWAGLAALVIAALLRRMKGPFRIRASKHGVEIAGEVIPPPDEATQEPRPDAQRQRRSPGSQQ